MFGLLVQITLSVLILKVKAIHQNSQSQDKNVPFSAVDARYA